MTDLEKILESKRRMRQHIAALPIEQKLRLLDALQERALTIKAAKRVSEIPKGNS